MPKRKRAAVSDDDDVHDPNFDLDPEQEGAPSLTAEWQAVLVHASFGSAPGAERHSARGAALTPGAAPQTREVRAAERRQIQV